MKIPIMLGSVILIGVGVGYFLFTAEQGGASTATLLPVMQQKQVATATNKLITKVLPFSELPDAPFDENKIRIQALVAKATDEYTKIIQLSGASGEEYLTYEEDWCVAAEDLSEADRAYAADQLRDWEVSRGHISFAGGDALLMGLKSNLDEFPGLNDEYLDAYREADNETLLRMGQNDDKLALSTILQYENRERFDRETQLKVAKQLVDLGDTSAGLEHLIIANLSEVTVDPQREKGVFYLKRAMALIEYGMIRHDLSSLGIFLRSIVDFGKMPGGIVFTSLTDKDFVEIHQMAQDFYELVNFRRADKGLPRLDELDESTKISTVRNAIELSRLYEKHGNLLDSQLFPESWKNTYIKKTPCVQRRIAMHHFRMERVPAIREEIAQLEKSLN
ncbi:MAG: hypothetical protein GW763_15840 [Paraglaciecola sp.]|nr:hypothetical protein [Paraglaciecola sp.]NCT49424.1 hypothetical protein [Paraglaciecola sp.]